MPPHATPADPPDGIRVRARFTATARGALALVSGIVLAGCAAAAPGPDDPVVQPAVTGFPLTITDAAGQEFTFDSPPRIGCLWSGCYEDMADLGVVPHAVSGSDESFASTMGFPVGPPQHRIADPFDPEDWARAEVDMIVHRLPERPDDEALTQAAPVFYLHAPGWSDSAFAGVEAHAENLRILERLTGAQGAADAAIARFDRYVAALRAAAPPGAADTTVAPLFSSEDGTYSLANTRNPYCTTLVDAGLGRCLDAAGQELNAEAFLAMDPDWIAYMVFADESHTERTDPVWGQLPAVQQGRVYDAGYGGYCCSLRFVEHALQEYGHHVFGAAGGIPDPGPLFEFDPLASPLAVAP